ncbi:hypothetical protein Poli38472_010958 [Pythium oligandrum]|uniref:Uncharacterized protein n=1 Tax=Pythium oligandrum TaxID=41045 RepID=A0A8K1CFL5_PYTOL|nr:hypothetical protein Poli38472_010958 [Pythium oligandrum]|eukprot:TMW61895.1 hypothetical protein Poli38472_010958 [Pythium oligandrum]
MVSGRFIFISTALLSALQPSRVLACPTCAQCSNSYAPPQGYRIYYSTCETGYRLEIAKADIINSDKSDLSVELVRADGSTYVRKVDLCFSLEDAAGQQFTSQVKVICNNLFSNCDYAVDVKGSCTRITNASSSVLIGHSLALAGSIAMALTALT